MRPQGEVINGRVALGRHTEDEFSTAIQPLTHRRVITLTSARQTPAALRTNCSSSTPLGSPHRLATPNIHQNVPRVRRSQQRWGRRWGGASLGSAASPGVSMNNSISISGPTWWFEMARARFGVTGPSNVVRGRRLSACGDYDSGETPDNVPVACARMMASSWVPNRNTVVDT